MANPSEAGLLDVVFIGAGPGGYMGAIRAAQNGLKTAIVDKEERPGGTCLLRGCIPTKSWLESASVYESAQQAAEFGVLADGVRFDWGAVGRRKDKVVAKNANGVKFLFRKNGVEQVVGKASIVGPGEVEVVGQDGSRRRLRTRHVVVATGSAPRYLPELARVDGRRVFTSDELLQIDHVPKSCIIVGAGAVGMEFASVFQRFGGEVTVVEAQSRLLPIEDDEISAEVEKIFRRRNVRSLTSAQVKEVKVGENDVEVLVERSGKMESLRAEILLLAVGRAPVSEGLGLEKIVGLVVERGFVRVNPKMETGVPWLSAIGDVVTVQGAPPHPLLAHIATAEGLLVADRLAGKPVRPLDYERGVISATYCEPEVASVGLTERAARQKYGNVRVGKFPFAAVGKAVVLGKTDGFFKFVAAEKHDELLGLHIVGEKATELVHEGLVALALESTSEEIARAVHAHPTLGEGLGEAAHAVLGKAVGV